jgi:hypothetical protein
MKKTILLFRTWAIAFCLGYLPTTALVAQYVSLDDIAVCNLNGMVQTFNWYDYAQISGIPQALTFSIQSDLGDIGATIGDSTLTLNLTNSTLPVGTCQVLNYRATFPNGNYDQGQIVITYAELPPPTINYHYHSTEMGLPLSIAAFGFGYMLNPCNTCGTGMPYIEFDHDLGKLSYMNGDYIKYTPLSIGIDTIALIIQSWTNNYYDCNGMQSNEEPIYHYYIIQTNPTSGNSFMQSNSIACEQTATIPLPNAGTDLPTIQLAAQYGNAEIITDSNGNLTLQYQPDIYFNGVDTVIVPCVNDLCQAGIYVFEATCNVVEYNIAYSVNCDEYLTLPYYNTQICNLPNSTSHPTYTPNGHLFTANNLLYYISNPNFIGTDTFTIINAGYEPYAHNIHYVVEVSCEVGIDTPSGANGQHITYNALNNNLLVQGINWTSDKLSLSDLAGHNYYFNLPPNANGNSQINLPTLPKGIYIVSINTAQGLISQKIWVD